MKERRENRVPLCLGNRRNAIILHGGRGVHAIRKVCWCCDAECSHSLHCHFHMCNTNMKYCHIVLLVFAHALQNCVWLQIMQNRRNMGLLLAGFIHCSLIGFYWFVMKCEELITAQLYLQIHCCILTCARMLVCF